MEDIQWSGGNWYGLITRNGSSSVLIQICWFDSDLLMMVKKLFANCHPKAWHGLSPMGQNEPAPSLNITYQTHMEDIQWSGGNWCGFMTTNGNSSVLIQICWFDSDLLMISSSLRVIDFCSYWLLFELLA
jgi:hypothetical protein